MAMGGARPGAGRKKGSRNRKSPELLAKIVGTGISPLDFLLDVMRDETLSRTVRLDAAKAAAPYVHPRLNSTELTGAGGSPLVPPVINIGFGNGGPGDSGSSA